MTEKELIEIIKDCLSEHTKQWARETTCIDDQMFCEGNGATTGQIAKQLNTNSKTARKILNSLKSEGLICKSKNNAGCWCKWWPVGYLAELQAETC